MPSLERIAYPQGFKILPARVCNLIPVEYLILSSPVFSLSHPNASWADEGGQAIGIDIGLFYQHHGGRTCRPGALDSSVLTPSADIGGEGHRPATPRKSLKLWSWTQRYSLGGRYDEF
jgi:hypothetical protein